MVNEPLDNPSEEPKLSKKTRFRLALMESGTQPMANIKNKMPIYYMNFLRMSPTPFATAHLLFSVVNAFNDPILGYFMDRASHKGGISKYKRYIMAAFPVFILALSIQLIAQPGWSDTILFFCVFLGLSLYDTGYAIQNISASSVIIQSDESDGARGGYVGIRLSLKTIFSVLGFIIPGYFLTEHATRPIWQPFLMFVAFGVLGLIIYIAPVRALKIPVSNSQLTEKKPSLGRAILNILKMKSYVLYLFIAFLITGVVLNQELFLSFYSNNVLELTGLQVTIISGIVLLPIILLNLSSKYLIDKFGVKALLIMITIIVIVANVIAILQLSEIVSIISFVIALIFGGFWLLIKFPINGNIIDEYAERFGERIEGTFFGIDSIFSSPAVSVILAIFMTLIERIGFDSDLASQTDAVKNGMVNIMCLIPIVCCSIALVLIFFFPFEKKKK